MPSEAEVLAMIAATPSAISIPARAGVSCPTN